MEREFWRLNKTLVKKLGLKASFFLTVLLEKARGNQNFFPYSAKDVTKDTGMSSFEQATAIRYLVELRILEQENKGVYCKRHFKVSYKRIESFLTGRENCE